MKDFKKDNINIILDSIAKVKTITENKEYEYKIDRITYNENLVKSVRLHIDNRFDSYVKGNNYFSIPKVIDISMKIKESFEIYEISEWKKELAKGLYIWGDIKGVKVDGFNINQTILELIDDFIYGRDIRVYGIKDEIANELYKFEGYSKFNDFIFVSGEDIFLLTLKLKIK